MEYRKLGSSDLNVSVIGFGAWGIGGAPFWSSEGDNISVKSIQKAYDLGINFFDTAPVYGFGRSERLIGKALKPMRDKIILATKCGLRWEKEALGSISKVATRESILEEKESLMAEQFEIGPEPTFGELVRPTAESIGDQVFLTYIRDFDQDVEEEYTYRDMHLQSNRLANGLKRLGIGQVYGISLILIFAP